MVGTKLPILLALTIPSLSAELVTVNLSGVTTGGEYVVTQNAYSGLYSGLPSDFGWPGPIERPRDDIRGRHGVDCAVHVRHCPDARFDPFQYHRVEWL